MAVLDVLSYPDPRLKQACAPVADFSAELQRFVAELEETLRSQPGGVGIAAPQVGRLERIALVDTSVNPKHPSQGLLVLVNPTIVAWKGMSVGREGCMSVPDYTGSVIRAKRVTIEAQDLSGEKQIIDASGYEARALQHELDHLDGVLFLDRLVSRSADLFSRESEDG